MKDKAPRPIHTDGGGGGGKTKLGSGRNNAGLTKRITSEGLHPKEKMSNLGDAKKVDGRPKHRVRSPGGEIK